MHLGTLLLMSTILAPARRCFSGAALLHHRPCRNLLSRMSTQGAFAFSIRANPFNFSSTFKMAAASKIPQCMSSSSAVTPPHTSEVDTSPSWTPYEQLVRKLYMTNLFNPVKLGLENMDRLHEALGRPLDQVCSYFASDVFCE